MSASIASDLQADPLDSANFDAIAFLNAKFPTEESLEGLDTFSIGISSQISALDEEISKAVQFQSSTGQLASKEIASAQTSIAELFDKINDIQSKSSQSERMVQDICSDIKRLDYAKKHLQMSITSLKRLQMLNNAVDQLDSYSFSSFSNSKPKVYRESATLLEAIHQLLTHFETFTTIPAIIEVKSRIETIKDGLKGHINALLRDIGELIDMGDGNAVNSSGVVLVSDSCLLIDALGFEFRQKILEDFIATQLQPYNSIFGPANKQHSNLEQVERRWAWIKRLLKAVEVKFGNVFPPHWQVSLRICVKFYEETKEHMLSVLSTMETNRTDNTDVHTLLKALQSVLRFESEMCSKFNINSKNNNSNNNISSKPISIEADPFADLANTVVPNGISDIFDKYLGSYVILERHNLEELIDRLRKEEDITNGSTSHGNVYGSSMSMFAFIKSSIKRCTLLTTGVTFLSLCKEFKSCMINYADLLRVTKSSVATRSSANFSYEVNLCYMVNTSEYCIEVVPQLEVIVKQKIQAQLAEKIDFSSELDTFADLGSYALKCLVASSIERMDNAFKDMKSIAWGSVQQVGEESDFSHMWHPPLLDVFPRIRDSLSPLYFNNFCMKLATDMLSKFQDIIVKQNKITEMGAQQLLLDTHNFKTVLLHLHQIGQDSSNATPVPPMYIKFINNRIGQLETILKLVSTPDAHLLERFRVLWPDGQASDLQVIMSIKGTQKKYQQNVMESLSLGLGLGLGNLGVSNLGATMSNMTTSATAAFLNLTKK